MEKKIFYLPPQTCTIIFFKKSNFLNIFNLFILIENFIFFNLENFDPSMRVYNIGVLMASHLDSPFDLERCGPAVDLALTEVNEFLALHNVQLQKVQGR